MFLCVCCNSATHSSDSSALPLPAVIIENVPGANWLATESSLSKNKNLSKVYERREQFMLITSRCDMCASTSLTIRQMASATVT